MQKSGKEKNNCLNTDTREKWICFDFSNHQMFERTVPVFCSVNGHIINAKTWSRVLIAIVEDALANYSSVMDYFYTHSLLSGRTAHPFLMRNRIEGLSCIQLKNDYWINVHFNTPTIVKMIGRLCLHCGYGKEQVVLYGAPKKMSRIADSNEEKTVIPECLCAVIRQYYSGGVRFDETVLRLIEDRAGLTINAAMQNTMKKLLYRRSDGLYFLPEMTGNTEQIDLLEKGALFHAIEIYGCIDVSMLYREYANLNSETCLRNEDDFSDFLKFLFPKEIRISTVLKTRIIRKTGVTSNHALQTAADKIMKTVCEAGCITQDDLSSEYPLLSKLFIQRLIEKHTEAIIAVQINGLLCYQSLEFMELGEDFSSKLNEVLGKIDLLSLTPSQDIIHALLSVKLGYNLRDNLNITDDRTFHRIISAYYTGPKTRVWKSGNYMEEGSDV
ncbi:MAG TPA: hypothetical protein H9761_14050 [Candidatus Eisenbergiella merdavium]|uniref:Uncharacterized protein n=1 Tax=Candidatus Eisenbergiella merdavium TaxID=2838551 RepID=A0A9D2NH91_9FIRM|nr:hypothetical protein [Candidatus Eisenbergiella merdavium]